MENENSEAKGGQMVVISWEQKSSWDAAMLLAGYFRMWPSEMWRGSSTGRSNQAMDGSGIPTYTNQQGVHEHLDSFDFGSTHVYSITDCTVFMCTMRMYEWCKMISYDIIWFSMV